MIQNEKELEGTKERIDYFLNLLAQFQKTCRPEEFSSVAGGYRTEVEKMQREVLDYLTNQATKITAKAS